MTLVTGDNVKCDPSVWFQGTMSSGTATCVTLVYGFRGQCQV